MTLWLGKIWSGTARLLAMIMVVSLVSCIEGREEIWIEADGSGRADVTYSLPAAAARFQGGESGVRQLIENFLQKAAGITSSQCEVTTKGDRLKVRVQVSFLSALKLKELTQGDAKKKLPPAASHMAGKVTAELHGLALDFSRTISPGLALPGSGFMPASQFKDRELTYIFHLPKAATESNATRIEDAGRTLIWNFPLTEAIQGPVTTHFKMPLPIPPWAIALVAIVVLFIAFLLVMGARNLWRFGSLRGKREKVRV